MATRRSSRRRTTRRRSSGPTLSPRVARELLALALLFLAIISVIGLFAPEAGAIVAPWHELMSYLLGWGVALAAFAGGGALAVVLLDPPKTLPGGFPWPGKATTAVAGVAAPAAPVAPPAPTASPP